MIGTAPSQVNHFCRTPNLQTPSCYHPHFAADQLTRFLCRRSLTTASSSFSPEAPAKRLFPLTKDRAKPAVYFGGPYRIIDFALSNCINSGLRRIFIATPA